VEDELIEFKNVTKRFGKRTVLDHVDLRIFDGHVTTIIGKSGTGKSVLLKHIIGLLAPTEGTILFRGKPVHEMNRKEFDAYRSQFAYCFQNNALFDSLTVFGNIALPLQQTTRMGKREIETRVVQKMEQLEVADVSDKYPSELSGGMQKRVALARALVTDPKIVLFDEPTTGQDPIRKNAILSMIVHNQKRFGFTTIMISHDIPDVFFISNRILILYDGKIIFQGTHPELDRLQHPMVDEYISSLKSFEKEFLGPVSDGDAFGLSGKDLKPAEKKDTVIVAVLTLDELDALSEKLGQKRTDEILQSFGEYLNRHFGDVGISNRMATNRFAVIFNHMDAKRVESMVEAFTRELREHGLGEAHADMGGPFDSEKHVSLAFRVGLAEASPREDIQVTAEKARSREKVIARFFCPKCGT
jgi:phospholipid/cholesterol/gamma-HCH transport system ATP-binding protein